MLLKGQTVLVVEPENFSAYALEQRLRDLMADAVLLAKGVGEAFFHAGTHERIGIAIVDCDELGAGAEKLAARLTDMGIRVVRTGGRKDAAAAEREPIEASREACVPKPYDMIDIERAIAAQYGKVL